MTEDKSLEQDKYKTLKEQTKATRYQPGESGNPGGRPKDPGITALQIELLDKPCPYAKDPKTTWRMWLAEKGLILATQKEGALEHLKERLEGKIPDTHKIEGDIPVSIVYKKVKDATD